MRAVLGVLLLVGGLRCVSATAQDAGVNLARGRPFVTSGPVLPGWTGLVDGDASSDSAPACFATANEPDFPKHVVIDLGGECTVTKVVVHNSANGNTRTIALGASTDGKNYAKLRDPDFIFGDQDPIFLSVAFQARRMRYVRITFLDTWKGGLGGDNCMFLREVEVFGAPGKEVETDPVKLAATQAPLETTRDVRLFRRYCLERPGDLNIAIVGDSTVIRADQGGHWATIAADELRRMYPQKRLTVEIVGGTEGSIAKGLDWATQRRGVLAPDLVLLSYGAQAAAAKAEVSQFRVKYQALLNELLENTPALVVAITPPPYLSRMTATPDESGQRRNTQAYAWEVEQLALSLRTPLVRTASVLSRAAATSSEAPSLLENQDLEEAGHQALGLAIAELLR